MNSEYKNVIDSIRLTPKRWLVTGVAGFIGSNIAETLLLNNQDVVGVDNFSTGYEKNLFALKELASAEQWSRFRFIHGDIQNLDVCRTACNGVDYVLHQAALGSVPRSVDDPIATNSTNVGGFLNMLVAARDAGVKSFTYAASSSTYGDHPGLPKIEDEIGKPLSPYAVTKYVNELYAQVFNTTYSFSSIGLRYFNVYGKRQDPNGAYAAVIPKWIAALINGDAVFINGDGETSRDFCFVDNAVQANILAATSKKQVSMNQVYNVAVGERVTLNELYGLLRDNLTKYYPQIIKCVPEYRSFRTGDVRHSLANIEKICRNLGYRPTHRVHDGLKETVDWYVNN